MFVTQIIFSYCVCTALPNLVTKLQEALASRKSGGGAVPVASQAPLPVGGPSPARGPHTPNMEGAKHRVSDATAQKPTADSLSTLEVSICPFTFKVSAIKLGLHYEIC